MDSGVLNRPLLPLMWKQINPQPSPPLGRGRVRGACSSPQGRGGETESSPTGLDCSKPEGLFLAELTWIVALGKSAGKRALCKALGVLCSQIWGEGGSWGQRQPKPCPPPSRTWKWPEGPSLAAEKHGGAERKEGRGERHAEPHRSPKEKVLRH